MALHPTTPEIRWERAARVLVALGITLRVARYALGSPLWWNEAFVAVNFLKRGYLDLLNPLDYGQVCPIGFLWVEKAAVDLFGFSEWTLRLFPLVCGVLGLIVFDRLAARVAPGRARVLAVSILAVSYHPIRLASEVKPYAVDLLVAVLLADEALRWLAERERAGPLWRLALLAPLGLAMSHPSAFVAGGVWLGLFPAVWGSPRRAVRAGWAAFGLSTVAAFSAFYLLYTRGQGAATLDGMRAYWSDAFPPLDDAGSLVRWLFEIHAGRMLAYPGGGDGLASLPSLALVVLGIAALTARQRGAALLALLAPFGLTLLAAAIRRHPYGGHPRIGQHLAPAICLLAGLGLAWVIEKVGGSGRRLERVCLLGLSVIGIVPLAADMARPYRSEVEQQAREFARVFWPAQSRDAEVACLRWDFGVAAWESTDLDAALYLCNQAIYGPRRAGGPRWDAVSATRPLRCVFYHSDREQAGAVSAWLAEMRSRFELTGQTEHRVGDRGLVTVFAFVPGAALSPASGSSYNLGRFKIVPSENRSATLRASREDPPMAQKWLESLSPEARARAESLIEALRGLGAKSSESWAHREIREGLPQISRFVLLSHLRDETVDAWRDSTLWVDNLAEEPERTPDGPFSDAASAVAEMLRAGISREEIGALARFVAYEAVFSVLHTLDEGYDAEREGELPGWALVERDPLGGLTGRLLSRLHLDLSTQGEPPGAR